MSGELLSSFVGGTLTERRGAVATAASLDRLYSHPWLIPKHRSLLPPTTLPLRSLLRQALLICLHYLDNESSVSSWPTPEIPRRILVITIASITLVICIYLFGSEWFFSCIKYTVWSMESLSVNHVFKSY